MRSRGPFGKQPSPERSGRPQPMAAATAASLFTDAPWRFPLPDPGTEHGWEPSTRSSTCSCPESGRRHLPPCVSFRQKELTERCAMAALLSSPSAACRISTTCWDSSLAGPGTFAPGKESPRVASRRGVRVHRWGYRETPRPAPVHGERHPAVFQKWGALFTPEEGRGCRQLFPRTYLRVDGAPPSAEFQRTGESVILDLTPKTGGVDGTRTRDLRRDRPAF